MDRLVQYALGGSFRLLTACYKSLAITCHFCFGQESIPWFQVPFSISMELPKIDCKLTPSWCTQRMEPWWKYPRKPKGSIPHSVIGLVIHWIRYNSLISWRHVYKTRLPNGIKVPEKVAVCWSNKDTIKQKERLVVDLGWFLWNQIVRQMESDGSIPL